MSGGPHFGSEDAIAELKVLSGWCIDTRRRQDRIAQTKLARRAGIAVRWLREIESGNPRPTIDDHLRCASALGLSIGYILMPMLCREHGRKIPRELLLRNLTALERRCVDVIANYSIDDMVRDTRSE